MSTENLAPLDATADAPPHDEYCARLMKTLPAGTAPEGVCFCPTFAMVRADELLSVDKALADLPEAERGRSRRVVMARLLPLMFTALGGTK